LDAQPGSITVLETRTTAVVELAAFRSRFSWFLACPHHRRQNLSCRKGYLSSMAIRAIVDAEGMISAAGLAVIGKFTILTLFLLPLLIFVPVIVIRSCFLSSPPLPFLGPSTLARDLSQLFPAFLLHSRSIYTRTQRTLNATTCDDIHLFPPPLLASPALMTGRFG